MEAPGSILVSPCDKAEDTKIWNLPVQEHGMIFYSILSIHFKLFLLEFNHFIHRELFFVFNTS